MKQKDKQADEKKTDEQERTVGFYLGEMKGIKLDPLSQMAGTTLSTYNLQKIILGGLQLLNYYWV